MYPTRLMRLAVFKLKVIKNTGCGLTVVSSREMTEMLIASELTKPSIDFKI